MALIKYTGLAHFRELAAADFKKLEVEGQKALTWARGEVKEVSDEVADALHELLSDEFEKVKEDFQAATASSKKNSSSASTPTATGSTATSAAHPEPTN